MNLGELKTLTRGSVPGAKSSIVKPSTLELFINMAVLDIAVYTACLKANKKFNVTADKSEYSITEFIDDYLTADTSGLLWNNGSEWQLLDPMTLASLDKDYPYWRDHSSNDPLRYTIDGDIITLNPAPDTTLSSGLWLYYGKKPEKMTASSHYPFTGNDTELPYLKMFDEAIIKYVEWKIAPILNKKSEEAVLLQSYQASREEKFTLFKRRKDIATVAKLKARSRCGSRRLSSRRA